MAEAVAVLKLAGPFIAPIISKLAEKASPLFGGDATAEKLDNLRTVILPQIQLIIDAAAGADNIAKLGPWLNKLKAAALEADDVLDEWEYRLLADQANPPSPLLRTLRKCKKKVKEFASPVLFKTKLMERVDELEKIASQADRFMNLLGLHRDSKTNQNDYSNRDTTGPSPPPTVVGREQECEYWVHQLTSPTIEKAKSSTQSWRAPIHAICGIGGAGKTTLAQSVFNDPRIIGQFGDMRIWVHLPRNLDVEQASRAMIEFITKGECPRMETLAALQATLREILEKSKNKILLILDDLWADKPHEDRIQLEKLLQPLNDIGRTGSMVLITTRMGKGAASKLGATNIVPLEELDDENCKSIILHYANSRVDDLNEDQECMLKAIVSKLKSSPLAARLVGNQLCGVHDWSIMGKGDMLEGTKNALLWSFKRLPSHLQSCFAFCSLYPKGFYFGGEDVDELVRFWIAQGLIEVPTVTEDLTIEEKGKQYFSELRFFSFFQQHPQMEDVYMIHDVLHELAEHVSQGHCFRIDDNIATNIPPTVIHISIDVRGKLPVPISDLMKLVHLRTFLILRISEEDSKDIIEHCEEMFEKLAKLRLLHFGGSYDVEELNSSIGKLKHLRYFHGRIGVIIPESLGTLYHLQYIHLFALYGPIDRVPQSLNNLVKLRCVSPFEICSKIVNIGKLSSLQQLDVYGADRTKQYGLQQLEKLQQIRGRLTINGLEFVKDRTGATIAMLKKKRHLEELTLKWDDKSVADVDPHTGEAVLEGLEPHPNLKKLTIWAYKGANPPSWMLDDPQGWLLNLTSLMLKDCPNLTAVPNLPCRLRYLTVENCPKLMQLYTFPCSLEELEMIEWPGTEAFLSSVTSYNKREQQQQQQYLSSKGNSSHQPFALRSLKILDEAKGFLIMNKFHSLSKLEFRNLPNVTSLLLGPHMTALENLTIVGLENLRSIKGMPRALKILEVRKCPELTTTTGAGGGEIDNVTRLPSFEVNLEVDDPFLLPVLLQDHHGLNSLVHLKISRCSQDVPFNAEQEGIFLHLTSLRRLCFWHCENLPSLPRTLETLLSIEELKIYKCSKIESLPNLPFSLESLVIDNCSEIESLPKLPISLKSLSIQHCSKIKSLPKLPSSLQSLEIKECHPRLEANYEDTVRLKHDKIDLQKFVFRVDLHDGRARKKAMRAVGSIPGMYSASIDGKGQKLTVFGRVDTDTTLSLLRKLFRTELISASLVKDPSFEELFYKNIKGNAAFASKKPLIRRL